LAAVRSAGTAMEESDRVLNNHSLERESQT
jgi:hypothetical protein